MVNFSASIVINTPIRHYSQRLKWFICLSNSPKDHSPETVDLNQFEMLFGQLLLTNGFLFNEKNATGFYPVQRDTGHPCPWLSFNAAVSFCSQGRQTRYCFDLKIKGQMGREAVETSSILSGPEVRLACPPPSQPQPTVTLPPSAVSCPAHYSQDQGHPHLQHLGEAVDFQVLPALEWGFSAANQGGLSTWCLNHSKCS